MSEKNFIAHFDPKLDAASNAANRVPLRRLVFSLEPKNWGQFQKTRFLNFNSSFKENYPRQP
jgi:hypothetical protein